LYPYGQWCGPGNRFSRPKSRSAQVGLAVAGARLALHLNFIPIRDGENEQRWSQPNKVPPTAGCTRPRLLHENVYPHGPHAKAHSRVAPPRQVELLAIVCQLISLAALALALATRAAPGGPGASITLVVCSSNNIMGHGTVKWVGQIPPSHSARRYQFLARDCARVSLLFDGLRGGRGRPRDHVGPAHWRRAARLRGGTGPPRIHTVIPVGRCVRWLLKVLSYSPQSSRDKRHFANQ
jgi:hypothetical protein